MRLWSDMEKNGIRKWAKEERKKLSREQTEKAGSLIFQQIRKSVWYEQHHLVFGYASFQGEPDTGGFLRQVLEDGKRLALPRVLEEKMKFIEVCDLEQLKPGKKGILEPVEGKEINKGENALVVVPGLAFDREFNRLGFGGGYYDRYFKKQKTSQKQFYLVGVCHEFQLLEKIPVKKHDVQMDAIVTPSGEFYGFLNGLSRC